ncbi:hypothetical protein GWI33_015200 [Rhynchophorus ferrugineus]|uniref:Uncharacterized protein n=1 Tax=Rhynchophorus ferrugineus TaxID=354439 RepID=A0A834MBM8_RHYFE|nr:hypothetical protein GWI33_015200 [Rhynchophorus ferrugineus]
MNHKKTPKGYIENDSASAGNFGIPASRGLLSGLTVIQGFHLLPVLDYLDYVSRLRIGWDSSKKIFLSGYLLTNTRRISAREKVNMNRRVIDRILLMKISFRYAISWTWAV